MPNPTAGTVKFMDGAKTLATVTLSKSNIATYTTAALAINTSPGHAITAVFTSSSANFAGSTPPAFFQIVNQAATSVALTSAPAAWSVGKPITFTAAVTATSGGTPTGSITFVIDGGASSVTKTLSAGKASYAFPGFASTGTHTVVAIYNPTGNFSASSSSTASQNVLFTSTTTVTSSLLSAAIGQAVTYTVAVTGNSGTPTGTVTFYDNGVAIPAGQSLTLDANGHATVTLSYAAAGTHKITAIYSGDGVLYSPITSAAITETIKSGSGTRLV